MTCANQWMYTRFARIVRPTYLFTDTSNWGGLDGGGVGVVGSGCRVEGGASVRVWGGAGSRGRGGLGLVCVAVLGRGVGGGCRRNVAAPFRARTRSSARNILSPECRYETSKTHEPQGRARIAS